MKRQWISDNRRHFLCIDSYNDGILKGRVYCPIYGEFQFQSLSQFVVKMEDIFDENQIPQSYTARRRFSDVPELDKQEYMDVSPKKGALATFELGILFRQNTSWQGILRWQEKGQEQTFRSVLEFILLLDSALRAE